MKTPLSALLLLVVSAASAAPADPALSVPAPASAADPSAPGFAWRRHAGDFPKDKPGYLILATEDAVRWSKMLPEFVKHKEAVGFHVYLATEKDYGTGKTGNAQAKQVRAWMREMQKRTGAKYALLIGNSNPGSSDLPSPTIPDGEHGGFEAAYCDLDGAWVDLYLETQEKDTRSGWVQACTGSILLPKALRAGGGRKDEVYTGRISYVGNEVGNGAYDLDRILEKTIRYERETLSGKGLDWRARALSTITNYGGANWDDPFIRSVEKAGSAFEWRSNLGPSGPWMPENFFDGKPANATMASRVRRAGMVCSMSHGWNRGGEGTVSQPQLLQDMDDRWPATVGFAACTAFALADNCNMGQAWLRKGGVFASGTAMSANNNRRVPMQTALLEKRCTTGEAVGNQTVQYGDPSLHLLPAEGPACALRVEPVFSSHYEERTLADGGAFRAVAQTYTLVNQSNGPMRIKIECDAAWITLSSSAVELKPGEKAEVRAESNAVAPKMAPGVHVAGIRFLREDGQRDERRLALRLQPVTLAMAYSFDVPLQGNRFSDVAAAPQPNPWHDLTSVWLVDQKRGPHWKPTVTFGAKLYAALPAGRVGGALKQDGGGKPFSRGIPGFTGWRGFSESLWFRVDALPAGKASAAIVAAPFALTVDAAGNLAFAQGGKPAALGKVEAGQWHFIQFRTRAADRTAVARLDGGAEVVAPAAIPQSAAFALGSAACAWDEIKVWSGELADADQAAEFAAKEKPFAVPAPFAAPPGGYADDGVLRAPKALPALFDLVAGPASKLDVAKLLEGSGLVCMGLREAPEWLELKDGVVGVSPGADFDRVDFGGYDFFLVLKAADGRVLEHPVKARIPVPAIGIRLVRGADNAISIVPADARRGLAKGVIRYTTDGSPVTETSPVYDKPFMADGAKVTARFFYLGEWPYAPVAMGTEFGIPRDHWKPLAVSGAAKGKNVGVAAGAAAFDGRAETAWRNAGGVLPQFFAWDMGREETFESVVVQSNVRDPDGRPKTFALYASDDGKAWRKLKEGEFASSPNPVKIALEAPCKARFLKFEAMELHAGKDLAVTEIEVYAK